MKPWEDIFGETPASFADSVQSTLAGLEEKPMRNNSYNRRTGRRTARTAALIAAVAVLLTTSALAVGAIIRMNAEPVGEHAVNITVENDAVETGSLFPKPAVTATWLPDGMEPMPYEDNMKYQYADGSAGGISILPLGLDVDASQITLTYGSLTARESLTVGGHDALYLDNVQAGYGERLFVLYPENECILEIMADGVARDDLIRFAEGLVLDFSPENGYMRTWSDWYAPAEDISVYDTSPFRYTATAEEMQNLHSIGEEFALNIVLDASLSGDNLSARVVSVSVADDFSGLDEAYIPDRWFDQLGENGKLKENTIEYFVRGDGVNTLDEVAYTEQVAQKVVIADVEYKNTGNSTLTRTFYGSIMKLTPTDSDVAIYDRAAAAGYDYVFPSGARGGNLDMEYYDLLHDTINNGGNWLNELEPGETRTVRLAFLVNEDEMDMLYLNLGIVNHGTYEISEDDLAVGYVDIRQ